MACTTGCRFLRFRLTPSQVVPRMNAELVRMSVMGLGDIYTGTPR